MSSLQVLSQMRLFIEPNQIFKRMKSKRALKCRYYFHGSPLFFGSLAEATVACSLGCAKVIHCCAESVSKHNSTPTFRPILWSQRGNIVGQKMGRGVQLWFFKHFLHIGTHYYSRSTSDGNAVFHVNFVLGIINSFWLWHIQSGSWVEKLVAQWLSKELNCNCIVFAVPRKNWIQLRRGP